MSINNLFSSNDFHLHCDTMTCNNLIPGAIVNTNAIYRLGIDPISNPDPIFNGLIVTAAETAAFDFALPLSANQTGLELGNTIAYDPHNHLSINGSTITCNKEGNYRISAYLGVLSNVATPDNIIISQLLMVGQNILAAPPGFSLASNFTSLASTPVSGIFNIGALIASDAIVHLNVGDQFDLKFYLAYDTCVISLTSSISINEL